MNLESFDWNKNYNEFIKYLFSLQDIKYRDFHFKLLKDDNIKLIGIKTPVLKKIASSISKCDYISFINNNKHEYYEETLLHGIVIANTKDISLLDDFLKYIDNWAINDIVATSMKYFKYNQSDGLILIQNYIKNKNPWIMRFGYVLLLSFYVNDLYIDKVIGLIKLVNNDSYYVKMSIAWLISICFIKYKDKTIKLFENNNLDKFIINKAISKINDSFRVSKLDKEEIKKYKVKE